MVIRNLLIIVILTIMSKPNTNNNEYVVYLERSPETVNNPGSSGTTLEDYTESSDGKVVEDSRLLKLLEPSTEKSYVLDEGMLGLPAWSPDGKYLSYGCGFGNISKICLIDFSTVDEINQENINNLQIYKIDVENIIYSDQMYEETQECNFIQSIQWGPNDNISYLCIMTNSPYFSYYPFPTNWVSNETICKGHVSRSGNEFVYENYFCTDFSKKMISPINNFNWSRNSKFIYLNTITKSHPYTIFGEQMDNMIDDKTIYLSVSPNKRYQIEIRNLNHIYLKDFYLNQEKEILIDDDQLKPVIISSHISWSSNSETVYLALNVDGDVMLNYPPENMEIYRIDIDTGAITKITSCENGCYAPSVRH